ncbi:hypothetical protein SDC9_102130 [bioreactor metagenome]|uniref:DAHP synthetase I/KDSA domain-containing protein n=1 Tax=bioreactor metagenome TaxID=1076179 RepID=A0A645AR01_9ZZZZ
MVDFSHGNSRKQFKLQMEVCDSVAEQIGGGEERIVGHRTAIFVIMPIGQLRIEQGIGEEIEQRGSDFGPGPVDEFDEFREFALLRLGVDT